MSWSLDSSSSHVSLVTSSQKSVPCSLLSDGKLPTGICRELHAAVFLWNSMMFQKQPSKLWSVTFTTCQLMSKWSVKADFDSCCWSRSQSSPLCWGALLCWNRGKRTLALGTFKEELMWEFNSCFWLLVVILFSCWKMMYIQTFRGVKR